MIKKIKKDIFIIVGISLLSLIPLFWFQPNKIITGTDLDFPLFPNERLYERLHGWYDKILAGTDRSNNFSSLPYFVLLQFVSLLGADIITAQKISYVFWFFLCGLGMYIFMAILFPEEKISHKFARFAAPVLYMFNIYQAFVWTRLLLALSNMFLFPVFLGLFIGVNEGKINRAKGLLFLAITSIICGTIGIQPPLIYAFYIALGVYFFFDFFINIRNGEINKSVRFLKNLIVFSIVFFLAGAYWSFPLLSFIFQSGYGNSSTGIEVYSVKSLLNWVSAETSFINVFRLFADAPWFDSWGNAKYFPEFNSYLKNPLLIFSSFVFPVLVFSSLLLNDKSKRIKNHIYLLATLSLAMLFFSKGSHFPLGFLFNWMIENVPMFWIHRAPWQKFTMITLIPYSALAALTVGYVVERILYKFNWQKNKLVIPTFCFVFTLAVLSYNYIFTLGYMYPNSEGDDGYHRKYNVGFHQELPKYLFKAREFINKKLTNHKILLLPEDSTNVYDWGYAGSVDISSLLFNKTTLSSQYGAGFAPPNSIEGIYKSLINLLYKGSDEHIVQLLGFLNVGEILLRSDFKYDFFGDVDSPEFIRNKLAQVKNIGKFNAFGNWEFFSIPDDYVYPIIYTPKSRVYYSTNDSEIPYFFDLFKESELPVFYSSKPAIDKNNTILEAKPVIAQEFDKRLEWENSWSWPQADANPNSLIYKIVKTREKLNLEKTNVLDKVDLLIWLAAKRSVEIDRYDLSVQQKSDLLSEINQHLSQVQSILVSSPKDKLNESYESVLRKTIMFTRKIIEDVGDNLEDLTQPEVQNIISTFKNLNLIYQNLESNKCNTICYEIDIPYEGLYKVEINSITDDSTFVINHIDNVNNEILFTKAQNNQESAPLQLNEGKYHIKLVDVLNTKVNIPDTIDVVDVNELYEFAANSETLSKILNRYDLFNIHKINISDWKPNTKYQVNLKYSAVEGAGSGFIILENGVGTTKKPVLISHPMDLYRLEEYPNECKEGNLSCSELLKLDLSSGYNTTSAEIILFDYKDKLRINEPEKLVRNLEIISAPAAEIKIFFVSGEPQTQSKIPTLSFYKTSPSKYKIRVQNAPEEFDLVFNQSFHKGWKLKPAIYNFKEESLVKSYFNSQITEYINKKESIFEGMFSKSIASDTHKPANGYANAWTLDKQDLDNKTEFELVLVFEPQFIFYLGSIISLLTCALLFVVVFINKHDKNH